jgi:dCMP deaminase
MRPSKHEYYLAIAAAVGARATCLIRCYGAVLVNTVGGRDRIISTGYCGAPRGQKDCLELGYCSRAASFSDGVVVSGQNYEKCTSIHGELNALLQASAADALGSTMYIYGRDSKAGMQAAGKPCRYCRDAMINAGVERVVVSASEPGKYEVLDLRNV